MLRCAGVFSVLTVVERKIGKEVMLQHPRLVNLVQYTVDELAAFVVRAAYLLTGRVAEIEYDEQDVIDPWDVPTAVDEHVIAGYLRQYQRLEAIRLTLIHHNIGRHPRLAAAIDMFWLQWKNLHTPRLLWEAGSTNERAFVMRLFVARHREIEKYAEQVWVPQPPGKMEKQLGVHWRTMTIEYEELAHDFRTLVPEDFIFNELMADWEDD